LSFIALISIFAFGHSFINAESTVSGPQPQLENRNPLSLYQEIARAEECPLSQTAVAYTESVCADGSQIEILEEENNLPEDFSGYYLATDEDTLLSLNSPDLQLSGSSDTKRSGLMSYIVKAGDSPAKVALAFNISLDTLLWANNLKNGSLIKPGQELTILPVSGIKHTVKSGENLSTIAKLYSVSSANIVSFNQLAGDPGLKVGQILIIPGGKVKVSQPAAVATGKPVNTSADTQDLSGYYIYPTTGWNWGRLHYYNAIDIANSCGTPIYATASGLITKITTSGYNGGYGKHIRIQHSNGTISLYAHLSEVLVIEGQTVGQGVLIGRMGSTGNSTGCHLHFELRGAKNPLAK